MVKVKEKRKILQQNLAFKNVKKKSQIFTFKSNFISNRSQEERSAKALLSAVRMIKSLTIRAPRCTHGLMQRMKRTVRDGFQFLLHPPLTHQTLGDILERNII